MSNAVIVVPEPVAEPKLLDRLALALRTRHYSRRTVDAYVHWVRRFILFHGSDILRSSVRRR